MRANPASRPKRCWSGRSGSTLPGSRSGAMRPAGAGERRDPETRSYRAYGTAELGPTLAFECEARAGLHWAEDHLIVELLDPSTRKAVAPGEAGMLVLTHLTREAMPLVRYWTGQRGRLDTSTCACGRALTSDPWPGSGSAPLSPARERGLGTSALRGVRAKPRRSRWAAPPSSQPSRRRRSGGGLPGPPLPSSRLPARPTASS